MNMDASKPGGRVKALMRQMGWTQQMLADAMGVSLQNIRIILNKDSITTATLDRIAAALGVPVWQLFVSPEEIARRAGFVAFLHLDGHDHVFHSLPELKSFCESRGPAPEAFS